MNSRERMLAALSGNLGDSIPVAPCYPNIYLRRFEWDAYLDRYRPRMGNTLEYSIRPEEDNQIIYESKIQSFDAWREMPDWIGVTRNPTRQTQSNSVIRRRDSEFVLVDTHQGIETNLSELARGESNTLMFGRMEDLAISHDVTFAEVDEKVAIVSKQDLLDSGAFDVAKRIIAQFKDQIFLHAVLSTPYTNVKYVIGFDNMIMGMRTNPDLFHYVVNRHLQATLELLEAWAALGIDGIWFQETLSSGDFIAPSDFDEFVFPANVQLIRQCQALGLKAMYYLTGDIRPRLPRLLEIAPDALAFEESRTKYHLDIKQIRTSVGDRLCLFGNIDVYDVLEQGSVESLRTEIIRQIQGGHTPNGAFITGIGSPITLDTSPERVGTFIRMARELGRYPIV